jgi:hypothetical protein
MRLKGLTYGDVSHVSAIMDAFLVMTFFRMWLCSLVDV